MLVSVSFPRPKERPVNLLKNERIDSPPWTLLLPVVSRYFYPGCIRKSNKIKCDKVMYANFMTHPLAVYNGNPPDMVRSSGFPAYQKTEVIMNEQFSKPLLVDDCGGLCYPIWGIVMDYHRETSYEPITTMN